MKLRLADLGNAEPFSFSLLIANLFGKKSQTTE